MARVAGLPYPFWTPLHTLIQLCPGRESSEDPIAHIDASAKSRGASKTQKRGQHIRYDSQSSQDPLAMDEHQHMSSLGDMFARVDIGGTTLAPIASGSDPIFVETEAKHGTIHFRDLEGHKLKTQTNEWQETSTDEGSHFLYTSESGQQYWTWEFGSASRDQASGSKDSSKKKAGKGKEKQRKK
ncbi:hypothetical protein GQX73_g10682 [Xylaria multiplex]|uniref:Uncharacterized protein n=1 Tax=Xylaria multiplex TaxID=323545 RepID=A0A7C8MHX0_9PEZI|nr:hypothetical protein GQX73_g10682 [Xylaria multiplex]